MSRNFMFLTSLSLFLFSTNCAFALTCHNDYSGTSGCAGNKTPAGTCETLGYYTDDVENCGHYIYCPFDTSYKRCTKASACDIKCKGFYTCSGGGRVGVGEGDCHCGNVTYYKECQVVETCDFESKYENGGACYAANQATIDRRLTDGYYLVGEKCTKINLTKVYWYASCTAEKDCKGNQGAAYGLKECPNGAVGSGKTVECGGVTYYEKCETLDSCDTSSKYENGGICYAATQATIDRRLTDGYYLVGEKCTKINLTKVYWYASCTSTDCEGNKGAAYGLKECPNGAVGSGKTVECGGITYYENCDCDFESKYENGGACYAANQATIDRRLTDGYYLVGDKCTMGGTGTKVYWYADCTTEKDCKGNKGAAYGLKECGAGYYAVGTTVECGGIVYGSECADTCNYELQASDCAENQTFVARCRDYNKVEFGECVDN